VSTAATLSILAGDVQHVPALDAARRTVEHGMDLAEGDRVVTGPTGLALITFLDGTTITVQPGAEVIVRQADVSDERAERIAIFVSLGTVWARIAARLGSRSTVSLESNAYTATAREGLIGAQRQKDGTFVCWTRSGALTMGPVGGAVLATLQPGQKVTIASGREPVTGGFAVNQSVIEVTTSPGVLPLLQMPDRARVAGFVETGFEVNQVFGSLTGRAGDVFQVEVPAGAPGVYRLMLTGLRDGPVSATVVTRFRGAVVTREELRGSLTKAGQLVATLTPELTGPADPRTARVRALDVTRLAPFEGPIPGTVLLSPREN
jgi:hypothetical protein